jgi:hypothetical protein
MISAWNKYQNVMAEQMNEITTKMEKSLAL